MKVSSLLANMLRILAVIIGAALFPLAVAAQHAPLTGRMMGGWHPDAGADREPAAPGSTVAATMPSRVSARRTSIASDLAIATSAATPRGTAVESPAFHPSQVGDTTRHLLQMQADEHRAGEHLPIPGDEASASYDRYMKSFHREIPEFYERSVEDNPGSGR